MLLLFAVLICGAIAGPITEVAVIPPGSNVSLVFEGKPAVVFANFTNTDRFYRRFEFQFLDYQCNQTNPFAHDLVFDAEIYANITFGKHPREAGVGNFTENTDGTFTANPAATTDGFTKLFDGTYNGGDDNKISLGRTIISDMCNVDYTHGYIELWVRPGSELKGAFRQGYFFCTFDVNTQPSIVQEPDSHFGDLFVCNSGSLNNYSHRFWFKMRNYNIDSKICQMGEDRVF